MSAADDAWTLLGAPFPLAEVPKPTELPTRDPVTMPVVSEATLQQARYTAERLDFLNTIHTRQEVSEVLSDAAGHLQGLANAVEELQATVEKLRGAA